MPDQDCKEFKRRELTMGGQVWRVARGGAKPIGEHSFLEVAAIHIPVRADEINQGRVSGV